MRGGVRSRPRKNWSQLANETGKPEARPSTGIGELGPDDGRGGTRRTHRPQRDKDSDEAEEMESQDEVLESREKPSAVCVDQRTEDGHGHGEQRAVPGLRFIHVAG